MQHELKCHPDPFHETVAGRKNFEFRKNDRGYKVGDTLLLREWLPEYLAYTGRELTVKVTYILDKGFGLPEGYCVLSIAPIEADAKEETARLIAERGMS